MPVSAIPIVAAVISAFVFFFIVVVGGAAAWTALPGPHHPDAG